MAATLIFALGILFWIQGNILVWDYGLLDGHVIIYDPWISIIDSLVWISILIIIFQFSKRLYRYIGALCALLLLTQAASLIGTAYSAPEEPEWKNFSSSPNQEKIYEFSTKLNVIIIILDSFKSKTFNDIINKQPEYRDMFEGFTYYRNNVGGY
ncbi:MAG: hypothetical protein LUQ38_10025, partial [Methanotrichaceae archaeon]|nr:hypothetical protein [Methanotrichaceae archaeon]